MVTGCETLPVSVEELQVELDKIEEEVEERVQIGELVSPSDIREALRKATLALVLRIRGATEDGVLPVEVAEAITTWRKQVDNELTEGASVVRPG
ncbi:MAG: hypothetical protein A2126_00735 [Candidatus Woykebacteria bacterium GWB1_45_5]|uniref:Uncharacterized protein n=2 Tax=Candidatus Woykeibacteriota TaxID=1817899 RepID=A0A1G1W3B3_9BACT|nr:MAG: hypothetical protein A2113_03545 [Candidatus Woykebacteria bacterium GWA1_44_8]OGY24360.1 MAG: hypothetical protein A2126_00735 [Candidatus Woykebacteria bacterium GWB1_45_5]